MRLSGLLPLMLLVSSPLLTAQSPSQSAAVKPQENYSGMYSFLREGEFVQLTIEDDGRVTGFVSRYGDSEGDRGAFLDQFFKQAQLDGNKLAFTTATIHGVWYDFKGTAERGEAKTPSDEGYYLLKGILTEYRTAADKTVTSKLHSVTFKSFPQDTAAVPPKRN